MPIPVITARIDFSTGPGFASPLILGTGILGTNALAASAGVTVDVSTRVDRISITRGRNVTADLFETGKLSLRILDQNGDFNPMNAASPYYGLLNPMRKVTIVASHLGVNYPLFAGYITDFNTVTPKSTGDIVYTTINAVDAFRLANLATVTTVAGAAAGDLSGTRINQILNAISWPSSMRSIEAGLTTVQADPGTSRNALTALQTIELSEYGSLYVDATGSFVFKDRHTTSSSITRTPRVFADNGTHISYVDARWLLNDQLVYNSANVTRVGGTLQNASSAASIALYFLHSGNFQNLMMETDAEAAQFARAYVASRQATSIRCDALTLDLYTANYDAGITAALALGFFDPVTITTTQPGASTLSKTEQVFGVKHEITPASWRTIFTTLEPIIDAFILGSSLSGILGTSVLSY